MAWRVVGIYIYCKVEFNRLSYWLYSMPNLLVFQHLEILYLVENHVRVVCERMWRKAQDCALSKGLVTGSRSLLVACKSRATLEIQSRIPISLHNLEHFFTFSHTLPLHDSYLNTRLLIAKIQANLIQNKAKKMVD